MHIRHISISNFRAITRIELDDLESTVIVAGPNGCGKSCLFDAIRFVKTVYGGYQPNEWHHFFGEFQFNAQQRDRDWLNLLQDRTKELNINVAISLSEDERTYLQQNIEQILTEQVWKEVVPELASWRYVGATPIAANMRVHEPEVEKRVCERLPELRAELAKQLHEGRVRIASSGEIAPAPSLLLELIFSHYDPEHIGIIDYHSASRNYSREQVGGINLNIESSKEQLRQHALYNSSNKYANLKTEMAASYIRDLLAEKTGVPSAGSSLGDTLKELFTTFFPGKSFLGPRPTVHGGLEFPVRTATGAEHDINELSSGEKEVLYGYLRLRNTAPKNSVILIDEPELHLNPRLINGLVSFYHRHLGRSLGNQLWLVTHSDTLIREAVGQRGFNVFHMQPPGDNNGVNQATPVQIAEDLERLVVELVGDLAAYRPGAKIVVFEGGGDSEFDVRMTCTLFPEFQEAVNAISGGNKHQVANLYELLDKARSAGHLPATFYAITDSDGSSHDLPSGPTRFQWSVYHIENYLLEPAFVLKVLQDVNAAVSPVNTVEGVNAELRSCAKMAIPNLIAHQLRSSANKRLVECLELKFDPNRMDVGVAIAEAVRRSEKRINKSLSNELSELELKKAEADFARKLNDDLQTDKWRSSVPGREILRKFVHRYAQGVNYEPFRDLIISRMREKDFKPMGMQEVIDKILGRR